MSGRSRKGTTMPPGVSLLEWLLTGEGLPSVPPEEIPPPPPGSFGEFFAGVEEDRALTRKNLDDARPFLKGMKSRDDKTAKALKRKGDEIVKVWNSSKRNLTFAEAVRQAEHNLGLPPGCDDHEGKRAGNRGRSALKRIGMGWAKGKGPQFLVP